VAGVMRAILIRGGRVIDPSTGFDSTADLFLADGRVAAREIRGINASDDALILDATGLIVTPGFVDLHTHLRFPGHPHKETIASGTAAAAAGGFTTICAMANTNPVVDSVETLRLVNDAISRESRVRVHQLGAISVRLDGVQAVDYQRLAEAGAIAFSDDGKPVWNIELMRNALRHSRELDLPVSVHEEDPGIVRGGVANAGPVARRLGLAEWPCSGEAVMVARDIQILQDVGGRLHIAHVSCADSLPYIREAKRRGLPVTAEVTPHHLVLTDELLDGDPAAGLLPAHPCTKVNPPLRSAEDVQAMIEALADGTIDAVATDHAPHTSADKDGPFAGAAFGFSSIEMALPLLLELVRSGRVGLPTLVERLTAGPARVFGLRSSLRPGARADVCVFDPTEEWRVTPSALRSKGKNSPLMNHSMIGRVRWTIVAGKIVWPDEKSS
jgi:dihydroorotase